MGSGVAGIEHDGSHAVEILERERSLRRDIRPYGPAGLLGSLDQCLSPRGIAGDHNDVHGCLSLRTHQRTFEVRSPMVTSTSTGLPPRSTWSAARWPTRSPLK